MRAILSAGLLVLVCLTAYSDDPMSVSGDSTRGFWAGINLAKNFNGEKVDRANGFFGKTCTILGECIAAPCRSIVNTAQWSAEHPWKSLIAVGSATLVAAAVQGEGDPIRGIEEWLGSKSDDDEKSETDYETLLKNNPNVFVETDGNGNKVYYEYPPEGDGPPTVVLTIDGDNNDIRIYPSDWKE